MNIQFIKARTVLKLGIPNVLRVFSYRISIKLGINPVRRIKVTLPKDDFFGPFQFQATSLILEAGSNESRCRKEKLEELRDFSFTLFGWFYMSKVIFPSWHRNPFNNVSVSNSGSPWWKIQDFDSQLGDIKTVWEASRFDWVLHFSQRLVLGDEESLKSLNSWLKDWCDHNPSYYGPNWKCGQEASIRVMHLAYASIILQQHRQPTKALQKLVKAHLYRIAPTIRYAKAQDNNHGTSEAAALFIGGSWLFSLGDNEGKKWAVTGRSFLENRAQRLIENDGSFSQYSVNYHRVMLDTFSMAEHWRSTFNLPKFSQKLYDRLKSATNWLYFMTQNQTGGAPNLGANDGSRLLPLSNTDYRDYRPSVQLAMTLFCDKSAFGEGGSWNEVLNWLNIPLPKKSPEQLDRLFSDSGGYSAFRKNTAFVLLRFPKYRFRPSQADALHVDLWLDGINLLRDGGTYSYNSGEKFIRYFGGTSSHNTIQFDDRDQMPRLSRFLFGEWLKANHVVSINEDGNNLTAEAGYVDYQGATHKRIVRLTVGNLEVIDSFSGFKHKAILRWRLNPGQWIQTGNSISDGKHDLTVQTSLAIKRFEIVEGMESLYYLKKTSLPVLEIEVESAGEIKTTYKF